MDFSGYPFPSPVLKSCRHKLSWHQLLDISLQSAPPEILVSNAKGQACELLFVSATEKEALKDFAQAQNIPMVQHPDLWADLLEPFLDTTFDEKVQKKTQERLLEHGLQVSEIVALRQRVRGPMLRYNAILWEWMHLSLYDVLCAMRFARAGPFYRKFYQESMEIALRYHKTV